MRLHNYIMMKYNCLKLTILSSVCIFIELPNDEITVSEMSKVFIQLSVMSAGSKVIVL